MKVPVNLRVLSGPRADTVDVPLSLSESPRSTSAGVCTDDGRLHVTVATRESSRTITGKADTHGIAQISICSRGVLESEDTITLSDLDFLSKEMYGTISFGPQSFK